MHDTPDTASDATGPTESISIVLPCHNEAASLVHILPRIAATVPGTEILVVDDGSTDDTAMVCARQGVRVVSHPYNMGNGAAVKTGARHARGSVLVYMDADGQHDPADIPRLLAALAAGHGMAVGARGPGSQASTLRRLANRIYNDLASFMTGMHIRDLTSGFRAVRADYFRRFLYLLPNGFSYPTTITMAFFRSGLPVAYVPIRTARCQGKSHIRLVRDGVKFLIVILKIGALFSPMRLFLPVSFALFMTGIAYYAYTFAAFHRFTNMSGVLFLSALFTFLIGIVAEQVSSLHYKGIDQDPAPPGPAEPQSRT
jgi:glycosyltransferase involved in cell wall biosynthesis